MEIKHTIPVLEIFTSPQGEGSEMGYLVTFVRLAGCNLRCPWCDTKESWEVGNCRMTFDEVLMQIDATRIVITGGEPCMHRNVSDLVDFLKVHGYHVSMETNGTLPTPKKLDWCVVSPKPGKYFVHEDCHADEYKLVIDKKRIEDWEGTKELIQHLAAGGKTVWLQPEANIANDSASAIQLLLSEMNHIRNIRMGIQMHKAFDIK